MLSQPPSCLLVNLTQDLVYASSTSLLTFLKDESGPTAVEYAVMLALIIVVCITAIQALGTNASNTFSLIGTALESSSGS